MENLLNSDLVHCRLDMAEKIVKEYEDIIWKYLDENKAVYEDFLEAENESGYELYEYLWYRHWEEVTNYLRGI